MKNTIPQTAPYPEEKARGGEVILHARWQQAVFILGLALPLFVLWLVLTRHW